MTNRDELNAMSNAEFGAWLSDLIPEDYPCGMCPAYRFCAVKRRNFRYVMCRNYRRLAEG